MLIGSSWKNIIETLSLSLLFIVSRISSQQIRHSKPTVSLLEFYSMGLVGADERAISFYLEGRPQAGDFNHQNNWKSHWKHQETKY